MISSSISLVAQDLALRSTKTMNAPCFRAFLNTISSLSDLYRDPFISCLDYEDHHLTWNTHLHAPNEMISP